MDYLDKARRVIDLEISELRRLHERLDGVAFGRAIDLLLRSLENRGKIVVVGVGKSGHIGEKIAATLTSTGSTAVVLKQPECPPRRPRRGQRWRRGSCPERQRRDG